ncbi:MAG: hypothetical protein Kow00120_13880 [Anaerolineae bacterium]
MATLPHARPQPETPASDAPHTDVPPPVLTRALARAYVLDWETIAYATIFVLALFTRFYDLGARVMSHDESLHTKYSWDLYANGVFAHTPLMHGPLLFHMTALAYFLFGDDDFTSRIYTAVLGVALVMMPLLFRRWIGRTAALLAAVMLLISPYILYYSRYIRHDIPAIVFALLMAWAAFRYIEDPERQPKWLYISAASMILMLASKEVAFFYVAIIGTFLAIVFAVQYINQRLPRVSSRLIFEIVMAGVGLGGLAAIGVIVVLTIAPLSAWNQQPAYRDRAFQWILAVILPLFAVLIGAAVWQFGRRRLRGFPIFIIPAIFFVALAFAVVVIVAEEASRLEPAAGVAEPATPEQIVAGAQADLSQFLVGNSSLILINAVVILFGGALIYASRRFGWWESFLAVPTFDVLILIGTLILPWITPFFIKAQGYSPTNYDNFWIIFFNFLPFMALSIIIGLTWNWRWAVAAAIFYGIFAFFFTTMFTNGRGLASGIIGSLGYWLEQQGVRRGSQPQYYYVLQTIFYEFLPLTGALAAGVMGLNRFFRRLREQAERSEAALAEAPAAGAGDANGVGDNPGESALGGVEDSGADFATLRGEPTLAATGRAAARAAGAVEIAEAAPEDAAEPASDAAQTRRFRLPADQLLIGVPVVAFFGYLAVIMFVSLTFAGEKMPWLTTHITTPLIFLAAWYFAAVFDSVNWRKFASRGWLLLILLPLAVFAGARVLGPLFNPAVRPFQGLSQQHLALTGEWLAALLVFTGAVAGIVAVLDRVGVRHLGKVAVMVAFTALSVITARSAWMASFLNYDLANEYLVYAHAAPAVKTVLHRIEELSLATTDGLGIVLAYDNETSWPYSWYFRDFTNARYFGANPSVQVLDEAKVIVVGSANRAKVEPLLQDRYYRFDYIRLWWPMQDYFNMTVERVDKLFSQEYEGQMLRQGLFDIWWNRDYDTYAQATGRDPSAFAIDQWPVSDHMSFFVRKDVAAQVWEYGVGETAQIDVSLEDPYAANTLMLSAKTAIGVESGLNRPRGVALDGEGNLYVADSFNHRIVVYGPDGVQQRTFGQYDPDAAVAGQAARDGYLNEPWGVAVADDGRIFVADTWNHRIQVFTPEGEFVTKWGQFGTDNDPYAFYGPRNVAVQGEEVFVVDTGNKRVRVYDLEGNFLRDIGSGGLGPGELNEPVGLDLDADGNLYVADTWNRRVQVLDQAGRQVAEWRINGWYGLAGEQRSGNLPFLTLDDAGNVYVPDPDACRIIVFNTLGDYYYNFGRCNPDAPASLMEFGTIGGMAVSAQQQLYVADPVHNRILRFELGQEALPPAPPLN